MRKMPYVILHKKCFRLYVRKMPSGRVIREKLKTCLNRKTFLTKNIANLILSNCSLYSESEEFHPGEILVENFTLHDGLDRHDGLNLSMVELS